MQDVMLLINNLTDTTQSLKNVIKMTSYTYTPICVMAGSWACQPAQFDHKHLLVGQILLKSWAIFLMMWQQFVLTSKKALKKKQFYPENAGNDICETPQLRSSGRQKSAPLKKKFHGPCAYF